MAVVTIDGKAVALNAGNNLLEALLERGVDLPYFCWHPEMGSVGACRQCAVIQYRDEADNRGRIVMSCMTPVTEGACFSVDGPAHDKSAREFRKSVIENLMISHPHDCPVCEEGGECHLQDMTVMAGHRDRKYRGLKATFRNQYLGPLINHEMNRCITCYRCVRFYQDYAGGHDLNAFASRDRVYFGRAQDGVLENEFAGNLVEVCPTGVFTDKPLSKRYTRKWDLQSAPSICVGCSLGCNISASERYGELRRIHNRYNDRINGYFLCDRGRFGGDFVNSDRRFPRVGIRNGEGKYDAVTAAQGLRQAAKLIAGSGRVVGIGSPRASIESNHLLRKFVGAENFYNGMNETGGRLHQLMLDILTHTPANLPTLAETEGYDAVLILGEDVTNHAPRLALSLRQAARNKAKLMAAGAQIPLWHDAAVRKLAQGERSPIMLLTPYRDRLDDVATLSIRKTPDQLANIGFAIAHALDGNYPSADAGDVDLRNIVKYLTDAKKPLIVAGTGLKHAGLLKAAANIAAALSAVNKETGIMLCADECNSVGITLLTQQPAQGPGPNNCLESLLDRDDIDTAIVLENDLSLRLSPGQFEAFRNKVRHLIVIDHMDNDTTSVSDIAFPAATFAEAEGTLINNEARAQRYFAVFDPGDDISASWSWLARLAKLTNRPACERLNHADLVIDDCAAEVPSLALIRAAAPGAQYRIHGMKVAREPARYSGRTAMYANVSVHEPPPLPDPDSPLTFSMEGVASQAPPALRPFVWAPGWNSNQAINKFQAEIGGPLKGGDSGIRVLASPAHKQRETAKPYAVDSAAQRQDTELPLVPRYHLFGSDELTAHARAIASLAPRPYLAINRKLASSLRVESGDGVEYELEGKTRQLEVLVEDDIADGCIVYPCLPKDTRHLSSRGALTLKKAEGWIRRQQPSDRIIQSDRST